MTHAYQRIQRLDAAKVMLKEELEHGREVHVEPILMMLADAQITTAQAILELAAEVSDVAEAISLRGSR